MKNNSKSKAKKSLGQNFLTSPREIKKVTDPAELEENETVLEIGPGKGSLTKALLDKGARVWAIEKDESLVEYLNEKFEKEISSGKLKLISGDVKEGIEKFTPSEPYKLVANIPYYLTGFILKTFLTAKHHPKTIVFLLQKEVVDRIIARDGKESILSISIKVYGRPSKEAVIKREAFSPQPKVDSAVLLISNISKNTFEKNNVKEELFFNLLKTGFRSKRKLLIKNLSIFFNSFEEAKEVFDKCEINKQARPENLTVKNWIDLATEIQKEVN